MRGLLDALGEPAACGAAAVLAVVKGAAARVVNDIDMDGSVVDDGHGIEDYGVAVDVMKADLADVTGANACATTTTRAALAEVLPSGPRKGCAAQA